MQQPGLLSKARLCLIMQQSAKPEGGGGMDDTGCACLQYHGLAALEGTCVPPWLGCQAANVPAVCNSKRELHGTTAACCMQQRDERASLAPLPQPLQHVHPA
jgi:hypothetical protein